MPTYNLTYNGQIMDSSNTQLIRDQLQMATIERNAAIARLEAILDWLASEGLDFQIVNGEPTLTNARAVRAEQTLTDVRKAFRMAQRYTEQNRSGFELHIFDVYMEQLEKALFP